MAKTRLTQRAADFWESAASSNIFLASSFFCSQTESQPAQNPLTPAVSWLFLSPVSHMEVPNVRAYDR